MTKRPKLFTDGRQTPLDRNDRARVMWLAQMARRRGEITRAAVDILRALLMQFANLKDGRCFPSYAKIAEAAGCAERTVGRCLPDLEAAGLVRWVHRIRRMRERVAGLFGAMAGDWRVVRTSNAYDFPLCAKQKPALSVGGHSVLGTRNPDLFFSSKDEFRDPSSPLEAALARLERAVSGRGAATSGDGARCAGAERQM